MGEEVMLDSFVGREKKNPVDLSLWFIWNGYIVKCDIVPFSIVKISPMKKECKRHPWLYFAASSVLFFLLLSCHYWQSTFCMPKQLNTPCIHSLLHSHNTSKRIYCASTSKWRKCNLANAHVLYCFVSYRNRSTEHCCKSNKPFSIPKPSHKFKLFIL